MVLAYHNISQARPNQPQRGLLSVSHTGKKSLVTLGKFLCATLTMDDTLLTWIGNAVYYALELMMQSLLRDVVMIYGTKLMETSLKTARKPIEMLHKLRIITIT